MQQSSQPSAGTPDDLATCLAHAVIAVSTPCRGCGYNLKGLAGEGKCPECGLPLAETILSIVDPAASRLPRLRDPRGVGNGLLWLNFCMVLCAALLMVQPIAWWFLGGASRVWWWLTVPVDFSLLAAVAAASCLWSVWRFGPSRGGEPDSAVRRDLWLLALALLAWAVIATMLWWRQRTTLQLTPPTRTAQVDFGLGWIHLALIAVFNVILLCERQALRVIGERSRVYRRSRATRQSVPTLIAGVDGMALGGLMRIVGAVIADADLVFEEFAVRRSSLIITTGTAIVWVCGAMVLIGLLYMLANVWWIRSALCRPPPTLGQLLLPMLPPDTHVPEEDATG